MSNYPKMTLSGIAQTMQINLMREVPQTMMILGQSGVGKTQWFRFELPKLVADAKGVAVDKVAIILTQPSSRDATEFSGVAIPSKNDEGHLVTRFSLPNLIEQIEAEKAKGAEWVIVVLDELSGAADDVMKAVAPILDVKQKQLGEFPLPDKTLVVATGNRSKDKAGSRRLLAHLPTRMKTVELMFSRLDWIEWARNNQVNELIVGAAESNENFFADGTPTEDGPYSTPRGAVEAAEDLDMFMRSTSDWDGHLPTWMVDTLAMNLGIGAANMVAEHSRLVAHDVPDPLDILTSPETANVPDNTGMQLLAFNRALGSLTRFSDDAANNLFTYVTRMMPENMIVSGVELAKTAAQKGLTLNSAEAQQFMIKYSDLIGLVAK